MADEMRRFKDEIRAEMEKAYTREVMDLKLKELRDEIDSIKATTEKNSNTLRNLWNSAFGKVVVVANGILVLYALSQLLPR